MCVRPGPRRRFSFGILKRALPTVEIVMMRRPRCTNQDGGRRNLTRNGRIPHLFGKWKRGFVDHLDRSRACVRRLGGASTGGSTATTGKSTRKAALEQGGRSTDRQAESLTYFRGLNMIPTPSSCFQRVTAGGRWPLSGSGIYTCVRMLETLQKAHFPPQSAMSEWS